MPCNLLEALNAWRLERGVSKPKSEFFSLLFFLPAFEL